MENKKKRIKKYPYHHTFRAEEETQAMIDYLMELTNYNKSFLLRECVKCYFDSLCNDG